MKTSFKNISLVTVLLCLGACASLHEQVYNRIHEGDTENKVVSLLGAPQSFLRINNDPNATGLMYRRGPDLCGIEVVAGFVTERGCLQNSNYVEPISAGLSSALQGAGAGLQNASRTSLTCISTHDASGAGFMSCH